MTHIKISISPTWPMGYSHLDMDIKKGKLHVFSYLFTFPFNYSPPPHHCLLADSPSLTVLSPVPLQCIQISFYLLCCTLSEFFHLSYHWPPPDWVAPIWWSCPFIWSGWPIQEAFVAPHKIDYLYKPWNHVLVPRCIPSHCSLSPPWQFMKNGSTF